MLVRSVGGADYRLPHTGLTQYAPDVAKIPAAAVTAEDADLLKDLTSQGPVKLHLTLTPQTLPDAESYNVIADWKGTEHPGAGGGGVGASRFVGSRHGCDRRRRGRGGIDAGDSSACRISAFIPGARCA